MVETQEKVPMKGDQVDQFEIRAGIQEEWKSTDSEHSVWETKQVVLAVLRVWQVEEDQLA